MLCFAEVFYSMFQNPIITLKEINTILNMIEKVDRDIEWLKREQQSVSTVYQYAMIEYEIDELMKTRTVLSRKKTRMLAIARKQGHGINNSQYQKFR
jgi:hypothetical protein